MKVKDLFSGRVFTLSNILSLSRIFLVPFMWYAFYFEQKTGNSVYKYYALLVIFLIVLTDFLDGYLARLLNQVSRLGQFLDPVADKISATGCAILLFYYRDFPLWIIFTILIRDIYAIIGGFLLFSNRDIQGRPNIFGRLMACSMGLSGIVYILSPTIQILDFTLQQISIYLIVIFLVLSVVQYWRTYSMLYFERDS